MVRVYLIADENKMCSLSQLKSQMHVKRVMFQAFRLAVIVVFLCFTVCPFSSF